MKETNQSPCIRECCLDRQDVCLGCFRHIDEIVGWQSRSDEEKKKILINCQKRKLAHTESKQNN